MSYNRAQLAEMFNQLTYYRGRAIVVGSAALVFHGLREEADDLDVALPPDMWAYHEGEPEAGGGDNTVPARYWPSGRDGIDFVEIDLPPTGIYVTTEDVQVIGLMTLLRLYEQLNRPKDQDKVAELKKHLAID